MSFNQLLLMNLQIFVIIIALMAVSCSTSNYRNYSFADGVMLAVTDQTEERIQLKIRNGRTTPIFFGRERIKNSKFHIVGYRLVCYQNHLDVEETDFGPEDHSGMGLDPLEPGDELEFEIRRLPKLKRNCYISIGYYADIKAVAIVDKYQNPNVSVTSEEDEFLEQSKQKIIVTLNLNNGVSR